MHFLYTIIILAGVPVCIPLAAFSLSYLFLWKETTPMFLREVALSYLGNELTVQHVPRIKLEAIHQSITSDPAQFPHERKVMERILFNPSQSTPRQFSFGSFVKAAWRSFSASKQSTISRGLVTAALVLVSLVPALDNAFCTLPETKDLKQIYPTISIINNQSGNKLEQFSSSYAQSFGTQQKTIDDYLQVLRIFWFALATLFALLWIQVYLIRLRPFGIFLHAMTGLLCAISVVFSSLEPVIAISDEHEPKIMRGTIFDAYDDGIPFRCITMQKD